MAVGKSKQDAIQNTWILGQGFAINECCNFTHTCYDGWFLFLFLQMSGVIFSEDSFGFKPEVIQ